MERKIDITKLTYRERQVMSLLEEGLSNKQVAERIGISFHTAKFHVCNAIRKLGGKRSIAVIQYHKHTHDCIAKCS